MIRLKLPALFLGLIFPYILFGQYSNFDLSKYKLPDIKTRRLDLNFNLNRYDSKDFSQISNVDTTETKKNNLNGALNLSFYHFRNSEKYQGNLEVNGYFNPQLHKNTNNNAITKNNSIITNVQLRSNNIFFNQNKGFIEVDPYLSFSSQNEKYHRETSPSSSLDENETSFTTNLSIPVSIGKGRIEPVEDVRLAIYILEELGKAGRISSLPTDDVILDMARVISQIKRKRFFDSRIRKIGELQVVDSFLVANNIISSNDINYFSVLNDQWDYAYGPSREAGFAISAGIDNNVSFSRSTQEMIFNDNDPSIFKYKNNIYEIGGFIKGRFAKPINLYWQTSVSFLASYMVELTRNPDDKDDVIENYNTGIFKTTLNYSLQFIPNSRTLVEFNIEGFYSNSQGDRIRLVPETMNFHLKSNQVTVSPGLKLNYYISPQLRISFNSSVDLFNSKSVKTSISPFLNDEHIWNKHQHNTSFNLIYSFF